jgi:hypothetical protein
MVVSSVKVTKGFWNYAAISFSSTTLKPASYKAFATDAALPACVEICYSINFCSFMY